MLPHLPANSSLPDKEPKVSEPRILTAPHPRGPKQ